MRLPFLSAVTAMALATGSVHAGPVSYTFVTDPGDFTAPTVLEGFESFATGTTLPVTSGILTVNTGNIFAVELSTFSSYQTPGVFEGKSFWDTADARDYTFTFSEGISQFGVGVLGMQFGGNVLSLYDSSDNLITSFTGIAGAGSTAVQFVGFKGTEFEVRKVVLDFGGVDAVGIDNVYYSPATIPLPAGLPLLLAGMGGLALMRKQRG